MGAKSPYYIHVKCILYSLIRQVNRHALAFHKNLINFPKGLYQKAVCAIIRNRGAFGQSVLEGGMYFEQFIGCIRYTRLALSHETESFIKNPLSVISIEEVL